MAKGRLYFDGDNAGIEKNTRVYSLTSEIMDKINSIPNVIDNTSSTSTTDALSANMGRDLQEQINNLAARGRFLSTWDAETGLPDTNPQVSPYTYRSGDYYIVSNVGSGTNYRPQGSSYTTGVASTDVETEPVSVNDVYVYDGVQWNRIGAFSGTISWGTIVGTLSNQTDLQNALDGKVNLGNNMVYDNTVVEIGKWVHGQMGDSSGHHVTIDPNGEISTYNVTTPGYNEATLGSGNLTLLSNVALTGNKTLEITTDTITADDGINTQIYSFLGSNRIATLNDITAHTIPELHTSNVYYDLITTTPGTYKLVDSGKYLGYTYMIPSGVGYVEKPAGGTFTTGGNGILYFKGELDWTYIEGGTIIRSDMRYLQGGTGSNGYEFIRLAPMAGFSAPIGPYRGQLWYDISDDKLKVYDDSNNWVLVDTDEVVVSTTAPSNPTLGLLWYDSTNNVLKAYDGTNWNACGGGSTYSAGNGISIDANNEISIDTTVVATQTDLAKVNTKVFTLSSTSDLTTAQAAWDWRKAGNGVIIRYNAHDYIFYGSATWPNNNLAELTFAYTDPIGDFQTALSGVVVAGTYKIKLADSMAATGNVVDRIVASSTTKRYLDTNTNSTYTPTQDGNPATKKYVDDSIQSAVSSLASFEVVATLPSASSADPHTIYLLGPIGSGADKYEEWIVTETPSGYTFIGDGNAGYTPSSVTFTDPDGTRLTYYSSSSSTTGCSIDFYDSAYDVHICYMDDDTAQNLVGSYETAGWYEMDNGGSRYSVDDGHGGTLFPTLTLTIGAGPESYMDSFDSITFTDGGTPVRTWTKIGETSVDLTNYAQKTEVLTKTNSTSFTPTGDYQPATKKYVDDNKGKNDIIVSTSAPVDDTVLWIKDGQGYTADELLYYDDEEGSWQPVGGIVRSTSTPLGEEKLWLKDGQGYTADELFYYDDREGSWEPVGGIIKSTSSPTNDEKLWLKDGQGYTADELFYYNDRIGNRVNIAGIYKGNNAPSPEDTTVLWYDTSNYRLHFYDSLDWYIVPKYSISSSTPSYQDTGALRYDTTNDVLKIYDGSNWNNIDTNTTYTAGDGIDIDANNEISVDVTDIIGTGLSEDASNNIIIDSTVVALQSDLANYYTKTQTYSKTEVDNLISSFGSFTVVNTLPSVASASEKTIYLLGPIGTGADRYEEWIVTNQPNSETFTGQPVGSGSFYYTPGQLSFSEATTLTYISSTGGGSGDRGFCLEDTPYYGYFEGGVVGPDDGWYEYNGSSWDFVSATSITVNSGTYNLDSGPGDYDFDTIVISTGTEKTWTKIGETSIDLTNYFNTSTQTSDAIAEGSTNLFLTSAERTLLGNTSGTNTGDETKTTIQTKLGAATSSNSGYLSSTDWSTFNGKVDSSTLANYVAKGNNNTDTGVLFESVNSTTGQETYVGSNGITARVVDSNTDEIYANYINTNGITSLYSDPNNRETERVSISYAGITGDIISGLISEGYHYDFHGGTDNQIARLGEIAKVFYLPDDLTSASALAIAQDAYDWFDAGKTPIIVYKGKTCTVAYNTASGLSFRNARTLIDNTTYSSSGCSAIVQYEIYFTVSSGTVTTITKSEPESYFIDTTTQYTNPFTPTQNYHPATKAYVDGIKPTSGSTAPSTTPTFVGQQYVDTTNDKMYVATGTSSSSDWIEVGAGSGDMLYADFNWASKTGATVTLDLMSSITPSANFTVNAPSTIKDGQTYVLRVTQGATAYTMTLGTHITNPYNEDLSMSAYTVNQYTFLAVGGDLELQPSVTVGESGAKIFYADTGVTGHEISDIGDELEAWLNGTGQTDDYNTFKDAVLVYDGVTYNRRNTFYTASGYKYIYFISRTPSVQNNNDGTSKGYYSLVRFKFSYSSGWSYENEYSTSYITTTTQSFLRTDYDYSTPYTPLYNGSPATKKYVDDKVVDKSWQTLTISSGATTLAIRSILEPTSNFTLNKPATLIDGEEYVLRCVNTTSYTMTLGTGITNPHNVSGVLSAQATDQFVFLAINGTLELQPLVTI